MANNNSTTCVFILKLFIINSSLRTQRSAARRRRSSRRQTTIVAIFDVKKLTSPNRPPPHPHPRRNVKLPENRETKHRHQQQPPVPPPGNPQFHRFISGRPPAKLELTEYHSAIERLWAGGNGGAFKLALRHLYQLGCTLQGAQKRRTRGRFPPSNGEAGSRSWSRAKHRLGNFMLQHATESRRRPPQEPNGKRCRLAGQAADCLFPAVRFRTLRCSPSFLSWPSNHAPAPRASCCPSGRPGALTSRHASNRHGNRHRDVAASTCPVSGSAALWNKLSNCCV